MNIIFTFSWIINCVILKIFILICFINGLPPYSFRDNFHYVLFSRKNKRKPSSFSAKVTPHFLPHPHEALKAPKKAVWPQLRLRRYFHFFNPANPICRDRHYHPFWMSKLAQRSQFVSDKLWALSTLLPLPQIMKFQSTVNGRWKGIQCFCSPSLRMVSSQVQAPPGDGFEFLENSVKCIVFVPGLWREEESSLKLWKGRSLMGWRLPQP